MSVSTPFRFIRDVAQAPKVSTPFRYIRGAAATPKVSTPFRYLAGARIINTPITTQSGSFQVSTPSDPTTPIITQSGSVQVSTPPNPITPITTQSGSVQETTLEPRRTTIRAKQFFAGTFDASDYGRDPFGLQLFNNTLATSVFTDGAIGGAKLVSGNVTESKLDSSVPTSFIQGGSLEIDGDLIDIDYVENNYTPATAGIATDVDQLAAHLEGIDNAIGALSIIFNTPDEGNKDMVASNTVADGDLATVTAIIATPANDGYVKVTVNGTGVVVGDGVKTEDCYFSNDGGTTARAIADIQSGNLLYWNGTVAGYELDPSDRIDFFFDT